uniref:Uncharacterized protein n=1 Tax=Parascaris equorum TaxID=6256 RepID=A0A914RTU2_PAREQ
MTKFNSRRNIVIEYLGCLYAKSLTTSLLNFDSLLFLNLFR